MKHKIKIEKATFKPVTISITFKTQDELDYAVALFGSKMVFQMIDTTTQLPNPFSLTIRDELIAVGANIRTTT